MKKKLETKPDPSYVHAGPQPTCLQGEQYRAAHAKLMRSSTIRSSIRLLLKPSSLCDKRSMTDHSCMSSLVNLVVGQSRHYAQAVTLARLSVIIVGSLKTKKKTIVALVTHKSSYVQLALILHINDISYTNL